MNILKRDVIHYRQTSLAIVHYSLLKPEITSLELISKHYSCRLLQEKKIRNNVIC